MTDGGCPIFSYAVFADDGLGGAFTEVNIDQDPLVRNNPGLSTLVVTSPFTASGLEGRDFRFYVTAFNKDGSTDSEIATITLADVPLKPVSLPTKDQPVSTTSSLVVNIFDLPAADT